MSNGPHGFDFYFVNVKIARMIAQILTAFSEKLNFIVENASYLFTGKKSQISLFCMLETDYFPSKILRNRSVCECVAHTIVCTLKLL